MKVIKPGTTALYPVPAVLVSCGVEKPNIITLSWVGTVCSEPPAVGISVRPGRFSHHLLVEAGEFVVNLPSANLVAAVDRCGQVSGQDVDKWAACGLTPAPASSVRTPLIAECPIALECRVVHRLSLGSHDLFVGQVLAVQVNDSLIQDGRLNWEAADLLTYVGGRYYRLGERLE